MSYNGLDVTSRWIVGLYLFHQVSICEAITQREAIIIGASAGAALLLVIFLILLCCLCGCCGIGSIDPDEFDKEVKSCNGCSRTKKRHCRRHRRKRRRCRPRKRTVCTTALPPPMMIAARPAPMPMPRPMPMPLPLPPPPPRARLIARAREFACRLPPYFQPSAKKPVKEWTYEEENIRVGDDLPCEDDMDIFVSRNVVARACNDYDLEDIEEMGKARAFSDYTLECEDRCRPGYKDDGMRGFYDDRISGRSSCRTCPKAGSCASSKCGSYGRSRGYGTTRSYGSAADFDQGVTFGPEHY